MDTTARIAVIGAGQVGLCLAVEFAEAGFSVTVIDKAKTRVRDLQRGRSYIGDVSSARIAALRASGRLEASQDRERVASADAILVAVPTPLGKTREPDMSQVIAASKEIGGFLTTPALVVIESTTYPGATKDLLLPLLLGERRRLGVDLFLAFSPERIDPGNQSYGLSNTPKVVSGVTETCRALVSTLYGRVVKELVPVSSTQAAETVKLLENTFRAVNIALANEISLVARRLGVDAFEVVRAAGTKPFGFLPFYPGPGLGGHCIPVDPLYLSWKLRSLNYEPRLIALADAINLEMPARVVQRLAELLGSHEKGISGSRVLVYGAAYKRDVADARESPALSVVALLMSHGATAGYMDPLVPEVEVEGQTLQSYSESTPFDIFDAVVICTDHTELPAERLLAEGRLILDTRDALKGASHQHDNVHLL